MDVVDDHVIHPVDHRLIIDLPVDQNEREFFVDQGFYVGIMPVGGGENDPIDPLPSQHVNVLPFEINIVIRRTQNDVVAHFPCCILYRLGKFWIERIDDRGDHETEGLGLPNLEASGSDIGLIVQSLRYGPDPILGLSADSRPIVQSP